MFFAFSILPFWQEGSIFSKIEKLISMTILLIANGAPLRPASAAPFFPPCHDWSPDRRRSPHRVVGRTSTASWFPALASRKRIRLWHWSGLFWNGSCFLSKKLANDACLWDNAVTKGERKWKKGNQYWILLASFWEFCFWFGLSGYILPFRRIGRLMKQNFIIFNRGIITVSWH